VLNPMSVDEEFLRTSLLPGLSAAAQHNWSVRERNIRLFEIGTVFSKTGKGERPRETLRLAAVVSGERAPAHWTAGGASTDWDEWDVKDLALRAADLCGFRAKLRADGHGWVLEDEHGGRRGWAGGLSVDAPAWSGAALAFECDIVSATGEAVAYRPVPSTPPVERDLALVLPASVTARDVEELVERAAGPHLESANVFDEYRAADLSGRSVAWRLVFRAPDRTLKDREVDKAVARVLKQLKEHLGVERRQT
jgi:phenylalanyl-tRNA synthetase beta chain